MKPLSRRTLLHGAGVSLALPLLEAMLPARSRSAGAAPLRLAYVYTPNGYVMDAWTPPEEGAEFALPPTLAPLADVREHVLVLSGLTHDKGRANGDGPGDHARACASFLTGAQPRKTAGSELFVGVSADQVAAAAVGDATRLRSLELGCEEGRTSGDCDSGYACAYSNSLAWRTPSTPLGKETRPRAVFERVFLRRRRGETPAAWEARLRARKSLLDLVRGEARRLDARLGGADRSRLEEYLDGVRELERRVERLSADPVTAEPVTAEPVTTEQAGGAPRLAPPGEPADHREHVRLMYDLLAQAFAVDATRVATFMVANEGSNRPYPLLDVAEGHHTLSHHQGDPEKLARLRRIDRFHVEEFARFLVQLSALAEGGGSVLDRSLVVFGSGLSDANRHRHEDLPVLLAGGRGAGLVPGRHLRYPAETPMNDLHLALLERMGAAVGALGDGRAPLVGLAG